VAEAEAVRSCRGREVRGLHAAIATQGGKRKWGREKGSKVVSRLVRTCTQPHKSTPQQRLPPSSSASSLSCLSLHLLMVSLLSSQPQMGTGASRTGTGAHWHAGSSLFKSPENH
jgi:hypothetical protein